MRVDVESDPDSGLVTHAKLELELAGLFDTSSDYDGDIAINVMQLVAVFSSQGHSGAWRRKWSPRAWLWRRHWRNLQQKAGA